MIENVQLEQNIIIIKKVTFEFSIFPKPHPTQTFLKKYKT